ncbi:hypothetical protein EVA_22166, partial [gut metagenome]
LYQNENNMFKLRLVSSFMTMIVCFVI